MFIYIFLNKEQQKDSKKNEKLFRLQTRVNDNICEVTLRSFRYTYITIFTNWTFFKLISKKKYILIHFMYMRKNYMIWINYLNELYILKTVYKGYDAIAYFNIMPRASRNFFSLA